jgi:hypothetical protein
MAGRRARAQSMAGSASQRRVGGSHLSPATSPPLTHAPLTPAERQAFDAGTVTHASLHADPSFLEVHLGQAKYLPCGPALSAVVAVEQLRYLSPPSKASLRTGWVHNLCAPDRERATR